MAALAVIEKAENDLEQLMGIWKNPDKINQGKENFGARAYTRLEEDSEEKLIFFLLQTMVIIDFMHQSNIYYGDMKP